MIRQTTQKTATIVRQAGRHHRRSSSSSSSFASSSSLAPLLVVAASTALAATTYATGQKDSLPSAEASRSINNNSNSTTVTAPYSILPLAVSASCEFLMPPPAQFMSRQQTVDYLDRTAKPSNALHRKYIIERDALIGVGSFGAVSKATCRETGQVVAIKKLPKESTSDAAVQRELQALLAIRQAGGHPSLTALREHFDDPDHDSYYLVMDLVAGGELFDALCRDGPLSEADAARFTRQAASALNFLHSLGLVHADLKPENCMLSQPDAQSASLKLVDFGCCQPVNETGTIARGSPTRRFFGSGSKAAKDQDELVRTAVTPAYCPPETLADLRKIQAMGQNHRPEITKKYDMWSLGVVLFVMLVGAHPFDLEGKCTDEEIAHNILQARVLTKTPVWHKHIGHLSPEAQHLLKSLMHPDPKKRLAAEDLLESGWVRGLTASSSKLQNSDYRLAAYRKHQTRVAAQFFKRMLQHSATGNSADVRRRTSDGKDVSQQGLLEAAFSKLEAGRGYISSKELHGDTSWLGADAKLNLPEATELLSKEHMKDYYFPAGHVIYREGDPGDVMYFIHSGTLEAQSKDGFVKQKQAGDFFGEDVLSDSENNAYAFTARCITPVHAIQILRKDYEKYLKEDEDLALIMKEHGRMRRRERARVLLNMEKKTKPKAFVEGDTIFQRGTHGDELFVLLEGSVEISVDGHKVRSLRQGEMTGEHAAYYGHKPYNVTAQCVSDTCTLGSLSGKELRNALSKNPVLKESFHDIIMRRDFKKALCAHLRRPFPETEEEMQAAFRDLLPEDGPRELELEALQKLMKSFDPTYTDEDILTMLASMDLNGSQSLTWSEFKAIFTMSQEG
eukprot:scaffold12434_cov177-Amphora_coffeaeformis.AAC.6